MLGLGKRVFQGAVDHTLSRKGGGFFVVCCCGGCLKSSSLEKSDTLSA